MSTGGPRRGNQSKVKFQIVHKTKSIESKHAEFKTSAVINIIYIYFLGPNKNFKLLIETANDWLTLLFVKSDERQMNYLQIMISHA